MGLDWFSPLIATAYSPTRGGQQRNQFILGCAMNIIFVLAIVIIKQIIIRIIIIIIVVVVVVKCQLYVTGQRTRKRNWKGKNKYFYFRANFVIEQPI